MVPWFLRSRTSLHCPYASLSDGIRSKRLHSEINTKKSFNALDYRFNFYCHHHHLTSIPWSLSSSSTLLLCSYLKPFSVSEGQQKQATVLHSALNNQKMFQLTWLLRKDIRLSGDETVSLLEDFCPTSFDPVLLAWYSSAHLKNWNKMKLRISLISHTQLL